MHKAAILCLAHPEGSMTGKLLDSVVAQLSKLLAYSPPGLGSTDIGLRLPARRMNGFSPHFSPLHGEK